MIDSTVAIQARLDELGNLITSLGQLETELRQNAANGLGRLDGAMFANLTGQVTLIASLRQGIAGRIEALQKQLDAPQPEQLNSRRGRRPAFAAVPPQTDGVDD